MVGPAAHPRRWMAAYVVATFFSFPHPIPFLGGAVLDLGIVVSPAVPVCLVLGLAGRSVRAASVSAFGWTVLAHGCVLHFIYVVTVTYGRAPAFVGLIAPLALATYAATLAGLFGAGWVWLRDRGQGNAFSAALLWTVLDHVRGYALTGWPWATLGYAQHLNPGLMGLAQWTAVYGLSFTVVLAGVALLELGRSWTRGERPAASTLAALGVVVLLHGFGFATRIQPGVNDAMGEGTLRVAVVQGNIDQGVKWSRAWTQRTIGIYEELSRQAAAEGAEVIVWPETALPGAVEADADMQRRLRALARETGASFVVGGVGVEIDEASGRLRSFFDSAFLVEPTRGLTERYDKTQLVPFGEYVPLRGLLGGLLGAVASGIASGDVTPGDAPRALDVRVEAPGSGAGRALRVGVPICYELLFPHRVRRFVSDGGGVLFGITNDAWYGRTGAPYHFLAITAMRSAETGVYLVRAANTGVSALIDSGGWVRKETGIFERAYLVADVPLRRAGQAESSDTFYVRHGDVFAAACWAALAGVALLAHWSSARREQVE